MPAACSALGIQFDYPDNWELEQFDDDAGGGAAVVSSPETAFWQISRHPAHTELEPLFDEALAALRSEYDHIEAFPASQNIDGREISGYDVNFYCLDLTNTCCLRAVQAEQATYLIIYQAEDRELAGLALVFEAMLTSLMRSLQ